MRDMDFGRCARRPAILLAAMLVMPCGSAFAENGADGWLRYAPLLSTARAERFRAPWFCWATPWCCARRETKWFAGCRACSIRESFRRLRLGRLMRSCWAALGRCGRLYQQLRCRAISARTGSGSVRSRSVGRRYLIVAGAERPWCAVRRLCAAAPHRARRVDRHARRAPGAVRRRFAGSTSGTTSTAPSSAATPGRRSSSRTARVRDDLTRVREYARLLASLGINGCDDQQRQRQHARHHAPSSCRSSSRLAEVFRPWGVRLSVSIDFSSPQKIGGLDTFDPLDPRVAAWWKTKRRRASTRAIPDLGGFVLKADSEGRLGPVGVRADARRRGQRDRARACSRTAA